VIVDEGIDQIPKRLDKWQVCQENNPKVCWNNNWQMCQMNSESSIAMTDGNCAGSNEQIKLQQPLANVPEWLVKFTSKQKRQLCQIKKPQSIATITGKCAWVTEQYQLQQPLANVPKWLSKKHQVATIKWNRDNVPPTEDSKLLQLRCCLTFQGSND